MQGKVPVIIVAFHLSGLTGPTSQFLHGTHEFSELVLARAAQFSRSGRRKRGNLESCGGKMYALALDLSFKLARTGSFRPARPNK